MSSEDTNAGRPRFRIVHVTQVDEHGNVHTDPSKLHPEYKQINEFLEDFENESDRGAALVAASLLDDRMTEILRGFLANGASADSLLDGFNAPLGTFSARIAAAHALALIEDEERLELNLFRKIRNEFGHSWKGVTFGTPRIASFCAELPWRGPGEEQKDPRTRFEFALVAMLNRLVWRARLVAAEKRCQRSWPYKG